MSCQATGSRTCNETKRSDSSVEGDEILMALNLSESILTKLKEILGKLKNLESKMDAVENTVKNLENAVSKMQKEVAAVQEKNENLTSTVNEMGKGLSFMNSEVEVLKVHRQPKLTLRTAYKLDCFFHAKDNSDIDTLCITMTSATFKSLYGHE